LSSFPQPIPGLVISYSYLWSNEHLRGKEEGLKDRPCAVILVTQDEMGDQVVTVLPITHTPPENPALAVEIPPATKLRLGLDNERSWIVLTEANRFIWPGPDLRITRRGDTTSIAYGLLPHTLYKEVTAKLADAIAARLVRFVPRTE
jgi:hypothetical protein